MRINLLEEPVLKRKVHPLNFLIFGLLGAIIFGSLLLWAPFSHNQGVSVSYVNALFTATSAATVTGLTVIDTADSYNFFGQLIILLLINMGGLGYMTIITFFLLNPSSAGGLRYALFMKESLNLPSLGDIFQLAKKVFFTIFIFELIGVLFLTLVWSDFGFLRSLWYGIFHAMSAFNNAGFDLMGGFQSFTAYPTHLLLNIIIMALIFFGGIGVLVISDLFGVFTGLRRFFMVHTKIVVVTSLLLIVLGAFFFYSLESEGVMFEYHSFSDKVLVSVFQSVTARTAGFATIDFAQVSTATLLLITALMFIGASPGSTGAGIKTTTFAVLVLFVTGALRNKEQPEAFGRKIARESVEKAFLLVILALAVVFLFVFLLSLWEPYPSQRILFEVVSAFGTVGLSTGITPFLTSASKLALVAVMFIGRLTPLTLLYWLSSKKKSQVELLEESVAIG